METKSINLQTLCVPCGCHCRYCLLSWDNHPVGADYQRSKKYAKKFHRYITENHPNIAFDFTFGYCMEHPALYQELDYLNEIGSVQGQFLQLDGMRIRTKDEADELMEGLFRHGVKAVNFTFYGLKDYHDRFAARKGDFEHLLALAKSSIKHSLDTSAGIPLTSENAGQAEELIELLEMNDIQKTSLFIPHEEGRGALLMPIRFSEADFEKLGPKASVKLNRKAFRPEWEWVSSTWPEEKNRALIISLTPDNIDRFENMSFEQVIAYVEALDEAYYSAIPSFAELCKICGNTAGTKYYSKRDLFRHYQKQYIAEHGLSLYDVTDERFCGSRRY